MSQHFGELRWPRWERWQLPAPVHFLNRALGKLRSPYILAPRFDHHRDMISLEQVGNMQLLVQGLLDHDTPGAFVELGCYTGSSAAVLSQSLSGSGRDLHVYDRFDIDLGGAGDIRRAFDQVMARFAPVAPIVHSGDLYHTVPAELPATIAFAHIDLGVGGDLSAHRGLVDHALSHTYDRLSRGGVMVLMDHHLPGLTVHGSDSNPAVREATIPFFARHGLTVRTLYGGPCSHGYVRKP